MLATSLSVPIHTYKAYTIDRWTDTYKQTDWLMNGQKTGGLMDRQTNEQIGEQADK